MKNCIVLLHLFDESQTRLTDFGYIPECKSKEPRNLNEISFSLARMIQAEDKSAMLQYHGDEPYRILVVQNRILFVISGLYLCKRVYVGRGKYPENHM